MFDKLGENRRGLGRRERMTDVADRSPFDIDTLRARYRAERDRRATPDAGRMYLDITGFKELHADPYSNSSPRAPVDDRVDVLIVGGGFGGLLAAARLREAASSTSASSRRGATSAVRGTGTGTPAPRATSRRTSTCRCSKSSATSPPSATPTPRDPRALPAHRPSTTASTTSLLPDRGHGDATGTTRGRWLIRTNRGDR